LKSRAINIVRQSHTVCRQARALQLKLSQAARLRHNALPNRLTCGAADTDLNWRPVGRRRLGDSALSRNIDLAAITSKRDFVRALVRGHWHDAKQFHRCSAIRAIEIGRHKECWRFAANPHEVPSRGYFVARELWAVAYWRCRIEIVDASRERSAAGVAGVKAREQLSQQRC
jgi:hypothetical protein